MDIIKTIKKDGYTINISYDEFAESPREWDNIGKMVCWHKRYNLGDQQPKCSPDEFLMSLAQDINDGINDESTQEDIDKILQENYLILPLYLYDHSGITMRTYPFSCPWDSGKVGFIYAYLLHDNAYDIEKLREKLVGEVEIYNQFLQGDVYLYQIYNAEGAIVNSCGGFYGDNIHENDLLCDAYACIEYDIKYQQKQNLLFQTCMAI